MIFQTQVTTLAVGVQVRAQVFERRIPTKITIELTIRRVARIADDGTPHLLARLKIAREDGDAVWTTHGRIDAVAWARIAVENAVRVGDKVFDAGVGE